MLVDVDAYHEAWKLIVAAHAKKFSTKEISLHHTDLRRAFFKFAMDLPITTVDAIEIKNGGFPTGMKLTREWIVHKAAHTHLSVFSLARLNLIGFKCGDVEVGTIVFQSTIGGSVSSQLANAYALEYSFNVETTMLKVDTVMDGAIILQAIVKLAKGNPRSRTEERNKRHHKILAATREVESNMDTQDTDNPSKSLQDHIYKRHGWIGSIKT